MAGWATSTPARAATAKLSKNRRAWDIPLLPPCFDRSILPPPIGITQAQRAGEASARVTRRVTDSTQASSDRTALENKCVIATSVMAIFEIRLPRPPAFRHGHHRPSDLPVDSDRTVSRDGTSPQPYVSLIEARPSRVPRTG